MKRPTCVSRGAAAITLLLAVAACSPTPTVPPSAAALPSATNAPATLTPTAAPTVLPTEASIALPDPGGTCAAAQFPLVGPAILSGQSAALGTIHVVIFQQLVNAGKDCDLAQPTVIGISAAGGPAMPVPVSNMGHTVCKAYVCHDVYPTSTMVPAGASVFITFNAWWWIERLDPTLPSPRPCGPPIENVTSAVVPFAVGHVVVDWQDKLKELCTNPPSFSLGINLATDLRGRLAEAAPSPCRSAQITLTPGESGVAAGTAYLAIEARNVSGSDCLLAREPAVSITIDGAMELASGAGSDDASFVIAANDTSAYFLAWNTACIPLPTGARTASVEISAGHVIDVPLGEFGPSCIDGSTGVLFMETESP